MFSLSHSSWRRGDGVMKFVNERNNVFEFYLLKKSCFQAWFSEEIEFRKWKKMFGCRR